MGAGAEPLLTTGSASVGVCIFSSTNDPLAVGRAKEFCRSASASRPVRNPHVSDASLESNKSSSAAKTDFNSETEIVTKQPCYTHRFHLWILLIVVPDSIPPKILWPKIWIQSVKPFRINLVNKTHVHSHSRLKTLHTPPTSWSGVVSKHYPPLRPSHLMVWEQVISSVKLWLVWAS